MSRVTNVILTAHVGLQDGSDPEIASVNKFLREPAGSIPEFQIVIADNGDVISAGIAACDAIVAGVCSRPDCEGTPLKSGLCRSHHMQMVAERTWANPAVREKRTDANRKAQLRPEVRQRKSASMKLAHTRPEVRQRIDEGLARPEVRERLRETTTARWADPAMRAEMLEGLRKAAADPSLVQQHIEHLRAIARDPVVQEKKSRSLKKFYADNPEALARLIELGRLNWEDPVLREKMIEALRDAKRRATGKGFRLIWSEI
jgi:hypothetical protein